MERLLDLLERIADALERLADSVAGYRYMWPEEDEDE